MRKGRLVDCGIAMKSHIDPTVGVRLFYAAKLRPTSLRGSKQHLERGISVSMCNIATRERK